MVYHGIFHKSLVSKSPCVYQGNTSDKWDISCYKPANILARARLILTRHVTQYSPAKTTRVAKNIWRIINTIASFWGENMLGYLLEYMLGYLSLDISVPHSSRFSSSFSEQIMSADKYRNIFSRQMEAIVYIYHEITRDTCILFTYH